MMEAALMAQNQIVRAKLENRLPDLSSDGGKKTTATTSIPLTTSHLKGVPSLS